MEGIILKSRPLENSLDEVAVKIAKRQKKSDSILLQWTQDRIEDLKDKNGKVGSLPVELIKTNQNIRKNLSEDEPAFLELVESIKVHGILQPPIVTVVTNEHGVHSVLLVGGERRVRAAKRLGFKNVNCLVKIFDTQSMRLTASMSENLNRKDLDPIDVAECYFELNKQGYKQSELVKMFGRDRKTIGRYIKIAKWPDDIKEHIRNSDNPVTIKSLMELASKNLESEEIRSRLMLPEGSKPRKRKQAIDSRLIDYLNSKKFSAKDKSLIVEALVDLEVIRSRTREVILG